MVGPGVSWSSRQVPQSQKSHSFKWLLTKKLGNLRPYKWGLSISLNESGRKSRALLRLWLRVVPIFSSGGQPPFWWVLDFSRDACLWFSWMGSQGTAEGEDSVSGPQYYFCSLRRMWICWLSQMVPSRIHWGGFLSYLKSGERSRKTLLGRGQCGLTCSVSCNSSLASKKFIYLFLTKQIKL